jgi:hypothetical protein
VVSDLSGEVGMVRGKLRGISVLQKYEACSDLAVPFDSRYPAWASKEEWMQAHRPFAGDIDFAEHQSRSQA